MLEIIPFDFETHFEKAYALWQTAFEAAWPLDRETFRKIIAHSPSTLGIHKQGLVAVAERILVGLVLFQYNEEKASGNLDLVLVAPDCQGKGIGTALHNSALAVLQKAGVKQVQLGGGFWHGIPDDLSSVAVFFEKLGWQYSETSYDLIQDLHTFRRAEDFIDPVLAAGISFRLAEPTDAEAIISFQRAEFNWLDSYETVLGFGDFDDLLLVFDVAGTIVGMVILYSQKSNEQRLDVHWQSLLGENAGAIGCVGIAHSLHNKGTGSAMMARAMQELKGRGVGVCHIIWTHRVTFYEKLGFKLWKSYRMSWRNLS